MRYTPNAVPDSTVRAELERISHALTAPGVDRLEFKVWHTLPGNSQDGYVYCLAAGLAGVGAPAGLYLFLGGAWTQL